MSNRVLAVLATASLFGLLGMNLGCSTLPSSPTPSTGAPGTAVSPVSGFTVTAISPAAGFVGEQVRVTGTGFVSGATLTLDGVPARVTGITFNAITATSPAHVGGTVDVVVTNPGGLPGTLTGGYTFVLAASFSVTASPTVATSGDQLTIGWAGPSGRGCIGGGDYIALYRVGDPDDAGAANGHSDLWFTHVCGATTGTSTLSAPSQAGQYEFRYMAFDGSVARSSPVMVSASASPSPLAPTLSIDGGTESSREIGQTFWYTGTGFTAGRTVTRFVNPTVNGSAVLAPTLSSDGSGNLYWTFTPSCGNPKNTVAISVKDDATGRISNTVTQTVTGSTICP